MLFFTWKDVDRFVHEQRKIWGMWAGGIEVYPDEMIVFMKEQGDVVTGQEELRNLFKEKYNDDRIWLDVGNQCLDVVYELYEGEKQRVTAPLFKEILYQDNAYPQDNIKPLDGPPVIAFHSYKGGVGRTLSLLAFAKAWTEVNPEERLLIVDADIEAPGITWMLQEDDEAISYLDLLEIVQCNTELDEIIEQVRDRIGGITLSIDTDYRTVEHVVLPTYRYNAQVLDMYSSPENIVNGYNKEYILAEVLSRLGAHLGVAAVLVDLRAGISEFSAPILFDPRVKKYIVTSTSYQSVKGTELLLQQLNKGLVASVEANLPEIFLTMTQSGEEISEVSSALQSFYNETNEDGFMDNIITVLPFASELIRIESLPQLLDTLKERGLYKNIRTVVRNSYFAEEKEVFLADINREESIKKIHELADKQLVAENNEDFGVLMTSSLRSLVKKFEIDIPTTVVMGAKGAGKTFLYTELLKNKYWETFVNSVQQEWGSIHSIGKCKTVLVPLVAPKNFGEINSVLNGAIEEANNCIDALNVKTAKWIDAVELIEDYRTKEHEIFDWEKFWEKLLLSGVSDIGTLEDLDTVLTKLNKRMVFLVDGLEEIFENTLTLRNEKNAIIGLARDMINTLRAKYKNIGCIVFLRKDVARNAIEVNYSQFENQYKRYELNWSQTEALRLALWLVHQAVPGFYSERIKISEASRDSIESNLMNLWGRKLGKPNSNEANASRWILAALSDFNGQLQARDIIRFLKYATSDIGKKIYNDRYIMPNEIRKAVPNCSEEKIEEIKQEIGALKPIFELLSSEPEEKRILPFEGETFNLSSKDEQILKQEGYLRIDKGKYYLPEIIRHALKFRYARGARPKVLSLIFEK